MLLPCMPCGLDYATDFCADLVKLLLKLLLFLKQSGRQRLLHAVGISFFSLDGQIAQFTQSFTEVAERVVGLLAFTGRSRQVVLKKG